MPYTFSVVAYKDWDNQNHPGVPSNPQDARGVKVLATNPDDPGDTHQFWNYTLSPFQDWSEWWVYIGALMVDHGMELEDAPPPDDDYYPPPPEEPPEPPEEPPEPPRKKRFRRIIRRVAKWFR